MSEGLRIAGGCHCRKVRYELQWPAPAQNGQPARIPARRCSCSFCTRIDGVWTSHPEAKLIVSEAGDAPAGRYRFATATADFLFCSQCGITPLVTCEMDGQTFAVVNINTFDEGISGYVLDQADTNFDGESVADRLGRRKARWIGDVEFTETARA